MKVSVLCLYDYQQIHVCKYVQSNTIFLHQHVSITPVTTIRLSYDKNTINVDVIVQKCMIKPFDITLEYNVKWFYHTFLYSYLYTDFILILGYLDDGHRSDCNEKYDKTAGYYTRVISH
jgi:hypothetical protein